MKTLITIAILLFINNAIAQEADNFGRGGTYLTNSSLLNSVLNSPSNLSKDKFNFEINLSLAASQSLLDLSKEDPNIDPGTYDARISPYYGKNNSAYGQGGIGIGYNNIFIFPKIYIATGVAVINNPVYPEANAQIKFSEGYGLGYGGEFNNWLYGFSYIDLKTKDQISSGKVLDYPNKVEETTNTSSDQIYNLSLGKKFKYSKIVSNYQHNTLYNHLDRYSIGGELNHSESLTSYLDFQDIQNNNLENSTHVGIKYKLSILELNLGLNQFYFTYGLGLNTKYFKTYFSYGGQNQFEQYRNEFKQYNFSLIFSNF